MQEKNQSDLRITNLNGKQKSVQQTQSKGIVVYPLKATFTARKNTNLQDKAAQNLKEFSTTIMKDPLMLALGELSNNNPQTSNIQIVNANQNKQNRKHRKSFMTLNNEALQILTKIPSLSTKIPSGQFERISINRSNTLVGNQLNESNNNTNRSNKQSMHVIQIKNNNSEVKANNQDGSLLENASMEDKKDKNYLQRQKSLQPQLQLNKKIQIQKMGSLNLPVSQKEKFKKLNTIIANSNESLQNQPFFRENFNDNLSLIPTKKNSFHETVQPQQEHSSKFSTTSTSHIRKQSQDTIQSINKDIIQAQNQDIDKIQTQLTNQLQSINTNKFNLTGISKGGIDNSVQQTFTLLSNRSKNDKLFSENNEDQQLFQGMFAPISNKTIDTSCLICSADNTNNINKQNKVCSHQQSQAKEQMIFSQLNKEQQNKQINLQGSPKKSSSIQNYSPNAFETEDQNKQQLKQYFQSSKIQISNFQNEEKSRSHYFHSRQGSDNLNQHIKGAIYLTNYSHKSSLYSPQQTYTNLVSPKNKPFYHPFSHQSTTNQGEDQNLASLFFLQNLSKYNQTFSTRKSSSSFRKSFNNSKVKEDDYTSLPYQNQQKQMVQVIPISPQTIIQNKKMTQQTHESQAEFNQKQNSNQFFSQIKESVNNQASIDYVQQDPPFNQTLKPDFILDSNFSQLEDQTQPQKYKNEGRQKSDSQIIETLRSGDEDQDPQTIKKKNNLFNLLSGSNQFKNPKQKWAKIFSQYVDSKDYLSQSKRLIPQKRRNLLYQYKQNGIHKSSNSLANIYVNMQQQQQQQNNLSSQNQQNQENQTKKRSTKSIQERINKNEDKKQNYFNFQSQNELNDKSKSLTNKLDTQKYKSLSPKNQKQCQVVNQLLVNHSSQEKAKSSANNQSSLGNKKDTIAQQFMNNKINSNLNSSIMTNNSLNKDNNSNENQIKFITYRERIKNESYKSGIIAQNLIDKKKIDDDPEIADQKIKLSKYFMDDNIPLQEKRNNFKDIQMQYLPENKQFDEKICREVLPFLNNMKNYFLKQEFYNPYNSQSFQRSDSKSKLMRGKTSYIVSQYASTPEQQNSGQFLSKFANRNQQLGEESKFETSQPIKGQEGSQYSQKLHTKTSLNKQNTLMFFVED